MESQQTKTEPKIVYTSDQSCDVPDSMEPNESCSTTIQPSNPMDLPSLNVIPRPISLDDQQGTSMGSDEHISKYDQIYNGQDMSLV